jgi:hypothetical protein
MVADIAKGAPDGGRRSWLGWFCDSHRGSRWKAASPRQCGWRACQGGRPPIPIGKPARPKPSRHARRKEHGSGASQRKKNCDAFQTDQNCTGFHTRVAVFGGDTESMRRRMKKKGIALHRGNLVQSRLGGMDRGARTRAQGAPQDCGKLHLWERTLFASPLGPGTQNRRRRLKKKDSDLSRDRQKSYGEFGAVRESLLAGA